MYLNNMHKTNATVSNYAFLLSLKMNVSESYLIKKALQEYSI